MASFAIQNPQDYAILQLQELFGNTLDIDVIKKVATSCNYDVMESSNRLIEISSTESNLKNVEDIDMIEVKGRSYSKALNSHVNCTSSTPLSTSSSSITILPSKSRKAMDFQRIVQNINKGYKVLVIMRGMPGSGKSYLSKKILEHTVGYDINYHIHILSADDFFQEKSLESYNYNARLIEDAHNWNQNLAFQAMSRGFSPVIIDNTNTQMWEMKPYATMAIDYGYIIEILEPDTHWCFDDAELFKRNIHGVSKNKIKEMIERYEKNITAKKLLSAYNLNYTFQVPPILRLYPPLNVSNNTIDNGNKAPSFTQLRHASNDLQPVETINLMNFDDIEEDTDKKTPITSNISDVNSGGSLAPFNKEVFVISSDDENEEPETTKNGSLYSQWGIEESTLKSWDIVTPLLDNFESSFSTMQIIQNNNRKIETTNSSTVMEDEYFHLLKNDNCLPGTYLDNLRVVDTINRDINHSTPKRKPQISVKSTLDKSCMTENVYEDYENHIKELENLFPGVPKKHLDYWYNKCKGDLEWTIEFLLEATDEVISLIDDDDMDEKEDVNIQSNIAGPSKLDISHRKKTKRPGKNICLPEDTIEIKKQLESKFEIGSEHYSRHLRRVKQYKMKDKNMDPSTNNTQNSEHVQLKSESSEEVVTTDSDLEIDIVHVESTSENPPPEDVVELNLGEVFVEQLEMKFADSNIQYPKGFLPVVQMPINLAKQLYSLYIESVFQQMENQEYVMETLVKEDEDFARKLQAKEVENSNGYQQAPTPSLKDIMEDQRKAKKTYQTEVDKWKNFNPDTLALNLTKRKLFDVFPMIPQNDLIEVLNAHDNKYADTVETLIASMNLEHVNGTKELLDEPPIRDEILDEMREAQRKHSVEEYVDAQAPVSARHYREEANIYLNKRKALYEKAQQYYHGGMTEVAQFYSGLATLQTIYYDKANNMAATAFIEEHSKQLEDFNTLDLHYLYVKEAIEALDVFLDRNINLLKHSKMRNTEYLQIITGRGNRSKQNYAKIKPAVKARLGKRKIKFTELNPGLLKVKIKKTSLVTSEVVT